MNSANPNPTPPELKKNHWLVLTVIVIIFSMGFWVVDHTPFASSYFKEHNEIAESGNRTADRVGVVDLITTPIRISLALLGIGMLMLPTRERLGWGGPLVGVLLANLLFITASVVWSINPQVSAQKSTVLICFAAAASGLARQFSIKELSQIFTAICLIYIGVGFGSEIALGNFTPLDESYRFVGTSHPNSQAVYASFCILVAIVYFRFRQPGQVGLSLLMIFGTVVLIMTRSRTTLAAVVLSGIFTWFLTFKPRYRVFATAATLLLFVAIGLALGLARGNIRAAVAGKLAMGRSDDVTTLTGRLPLWELLWEAIEEQPLIGHGYLAFWTREKIEYMSDQLNWEVPHGHNMYLDVLLDGGLIGLVLFGAIFLLASAQSLFRSIVYRDRDMALVFGFVSFAIVHGVAESLFKLPTFLAFMLLALLLRMALQSSAPPTAAVQSAGESAVLLEPAT